MYMYVYTHVHMYMYVVADSEYCSPCGYIHVYVKSASQACKCSSLILELHILVCIQHVCKYFLCIFGRIRSRPGEGCDL